MNVIDEEDSASLSSSFEECSLMRSSIYDPRDQRGFPSRQTTQDDSMDRGIRISTFVSTFEEPLSKSESLRVPAFLNDTGVYARTGGRRHSQATREEDSTQPVSRKSFIKVSVDDSVLPPSHPVELSPMERKTERPAEPRKNSSVEMFPLLVRGLETSKSNEIQYKRSDSAFELKTVLDMVRKGKEDTSDKDDGKTGGSLMYKAKVEYLHKLAIGNPKPQEVLYKLLCVQANAEGIDTGITGLSDLRNHMKDKELLAASAKELAELNAAYQSATSTKETLEASTDSANEELSKTTEEIKRETEVIVSRTFSIKGANRRHVLGRADLNRKIENSQKLRLKLESQLEAEKESAETVKRTLDEEWERAAMRRNELETVLTDVDTRKERMREKAERCSDAIDIMRREKEKQSELERRIHSALQLLQDTLQYVKEFADREDFIDEYVEELKLLQTECGEAAEAERRFEEQAKEDPRRLLPYSRSTVTSNVAKF